MKQIENIRISIRLNLLLAEKSIRENNLAIAMNQIQNARRLLDVLKVLTEESKVK